ncbi:MAG: DmsC/YnfH family molybdoenzyme membrane anchor subunit [Pseudomonadota bacterium]
MHPAPSIIFFTVFSGIGFGMLFWLGAGYPAVTGWSAFAFFAVAYILAVGGLISSTFHLGHPERALKAFTQWRSSWLSREAWSATVTLILMAIYGAGLVFFGQAWTIFGALGAVMSLVTVYTTSMLYAQLKTVPRWRQPTTPALFLLLAVSGGALLTNQLWAAYPLFVLLLVVQVYAWAKGDTALAGSGTDIATATGLGDRGTVRAFEPPHTGKNYLLKEMVHVIGRKHAAKLRIIAFVLIAAPLLMVFVDTPGHALGALAVLVHVAGVLVLRWLFFAQAEHVVGLYYGKR